LALSVSAILMPHPVQASSKTLWNRLTHRSKSASPTRLRSFVSTMADKHGNEGANTEVPRRTLNAVLQSETAFFTNTSQSQLPLISHLHNEGTITSRESESKHTNGARSAQQRDGRARRDMNALITCTTYNRPSRKEARHR
jgi:hypothetical protein